MDDAPNYFETISDEDDPEIDVIFSSWEPFASSPAKDMAKWITTVNANYGTTIPTSKPWYFRVGDIIEFPSGDTAEVLSVGTSSLGMDQTVTASTGDAIMLAEFPFDGLGPRYWSGRT